MTHGLPFFWANCRSRISSCAPSNHSQCIGLVEAHFRGSACTTLLSASRCCWPCRLLPASLHTRPILPQSADAQHSCTPCSAFDINPYQICLSRLFTSAVPRRRRRRRVGLCIELVLWSWQLRELVLSCMQAYERESCDATLHQADVQSRGASPVPVQMWEGLSPVPVQMWEGLSPVPVQMCRAKVPVPMQMWEGLSPVPAQMCRAKVPTMASHWRLEALRWSACVDYGASHRRWLLWTGIVSGQEALTFFLRTNLDMETLAQVPFHICTGTGHTAATSAPGTGPTAATSAPGLGAPPPHLHYDWVCRCHISTGTWSTAPLC